MATTLMPPAASAEKTPAAMPGRAVHAESDHGDRRHARAHLDAVDLPPRDLAAELALERGAGVVGERRSGTLKQIECSDEACEISETEIRRAVQRARRCARRCPARPACRCR